MPQVCVGDRQLQVAKVTFLFRPVPRRAAGFFFLLSPVYTLPSGGGGVW